ncbi:hypothetical protein JCM9743_02490 [Natrinema sp. JCM 9743]
MTVRSASISVDAAGRPATDAALLASLDTDRTRDGVADGDGSDTRTGIRSRPFGVSVRDRLHLDLIGAGGNVAGDFDVGMGFDEVTLERPVEFEYVAADRTLDRRFEYHLFVTLRPVEGNRYSMHMPADP